MLPTIKVTEPLRCSADFLVFQEHLLNTPLYRQTLIYALQAKSGQRILDAGCGAGFVAQLILEEIPKCQVYGVDLDPHLLHIGISRTQMLSHRPLFLHRDVRQLDFPDGYFDRVFCQLLLCNLEQVEPVLSEVIRVLKPYGRLVCIEPVNVKTRLYCSEKPLMEAMTLHYQQERETLVKNGANPDIGFHLPQLMRESKLSELFVAGIGRVFKGIAFLPEEYWLAKPDSQRVYRDLSGVFGTLLAHRYTNALLQEDQAGLKAHYGSLVVTPLIVAAGSKS
jgi:ubiquinone/menaquinone biosynthesis C-methylase UbiE